MAPPYMLLPTMLPASSVPVGSLVCSLSEPHVDLFKAESKTQGPEALETQVLSLSTFIHSAKSHRFSAALTRLLDVHFETNSGGNTYLSTKTAKRYELTAQRKAFIELCANKAAQEWLEEGAKAGEKSYLVVGTTTVLDAEVQQAQTQQRKMGTDLTAPVSTVLSGGIDMFGLLDPGAGIEGSKQTDKGMSFTAPGEMIWAIAYRKIKFQSFKKRTASTAFLDSTIHWKPLAGQRAQEADEEEELQAELEDIDISEEEDLAECLRDDDDEFIIPASLGNAKGSETSS